MKTKKLIASQVKITLSFIILVSMQLSCTKDWLDKKPVTNTVIPINLKDCQALLDNDALFATNCPALGELASDGHYINALNVPNIVNDDRNAYTWSNSPAYQLVPDWSVVVGVGGAYGKIFVCNLVLETLKKIIQNGQNISEYNDIKGQALFLRSKAYYELAQLYAEPYVHGEKNDGLGLPLRLETNINIPSVRSTVQQTYDQIVKDIKDALNLLPMNGLFKTHASKHTANAILARIYLSMEDYTQAGFYAQQALNMNSALLDYSKLIPTANFPIPLFNDEVVFHSTLLNSSALTSFARIDSALKAMYHPDDLRNTIFFTTSAGQHTFKGYYYGSRLCFNGLANDEILLIRAESYARSGNTNAAMEDINLLLKNRYKKNAGVTTYVNQIATSPEAALKIVIDERKKELLLRGLRWSDLRRLNRDPRFAVVVSRIVDGKTYTLEPNSFKYTFPIPQPIIGITGMPQNFGW